MKDHVLRLELKLVFPEGLHPGENRNGNHAFIARDGKGHPVLRGTALAGTLRHAWEDKHPSDHNTWFGNALDADSIDRNSSPLRVQDMVLNTGSANTSVRTHIALDRHRGSVIDGGLFSLEALPPGTQARQVLQLEIFDDQKVEAKTFLQSLVTLFDNGLSLGGNSARGLGRVVLESSSYREFNLKDIQQRALWLNEMYALRHDSTITLTGDPLPLVADATADQLVVQLTLGIPNAEDLLLGDGQGLDHEMEPQVIRAADGREYWRIPGSSLRGVFRAWMTRLAARAGLPVADNVERALDRQARGEKLTGEDIARGFDSTGEKPVECPIMDLFGSSRSKGRFFISDALSEVPGNDENLQHRMHVAIDRITGGANEGFLFDNAVLTHGPTFKTTLQINTPGEQEVAWLCATLRALDVGVLRIGSSKAGGRMGILDLSAKGSRSGDCMSSWKQMTQKEVQS